MIRRFAAAILLALAVLAGATGVVQAQDAAPRQIWPQATAAARDGDFETAEKLTATLLGAGKTFGLRTYPSYAEGAAALSWSSAQTNRELYDWASTTASRLDGMSPAVMFGEADRAMRAGNLIGAAKLVFNGLTRAARNDRARTLAMADLLVVALFAIAITSIVFAVTLFFRYSRSAGHDFREMLGNLLGGGSVTVLAFALLFLPLFLWLGPMWLVFYWFAIFFGYAGRVERTMIVVLLLLVALLPIAADAAAHRMATIDSPVMMAALSSTNRAYRPEALPRLEELVGVVPDQPVLHLLLGNMLAFDGFDDRAAAHYRRAMELRPGYAGAHVNLGNLLYLNNDFQAAMTEYRRAQQIDPGLGAAYYNLSVVNGETYRFAQQAEMLERARSADPALLDRIRRNPPPQKVVMYDPPLPEAWSVASLVPRRNAARGLFGSYSTPNPAQAALSPVTLGAALSLLLAIAIWSRRRRHGFANACIKCGRTFCYRCKSARESATYCTQCIHIYLKRDGVSLETKRLKLEEVSEHYSWIARRNRIFALILPGSAQMLEGRTVTGIAGLLLAAFFTGVAIFIGRLAPAFGPSADTVQLLIRSAAIAIAVVIWLVMLVRTYRRRSAV